MLDKGKPEDIMPSIKGAKVINVESLILVFLFMLLTSVNVSNIKSVYELLCD